ncbi:MAG TPA: HNH endonuclease signature motif containing protein [Geminicoccaceae bacterium]|nr:HNH endonuclease signature motif containing protein [Geminicoccaceae bacterium]
MGSRRAEAAAPETRPEQEEVAAKDDLCPFCGRPLAEAPSVNRHHVVPRSEGGRETVRLHRICHRKLHSLWTERELARRFASLAAGREHPEMRAFIRWVQRKPPEFHARTFDVRHKGSRRG